MIDTYTKVVLTLIAAALWAMLLRPFVIPSSLKASDIQDVNLLQIDGARIPYAPAIPVKLKGR